MCCVSGINEGEGDKQFPVYIADADDYTALSDDETSGDQKGDVNLLPKSVPDFDEYTRLGEYTSKNMYMKIIRYMAVTIFYLQSNTITRKYTFKYTEYSNKTKIYVLESFKIKKKNNNILSYL